MTTPAERLPRQIAGAVIGTVLVRLLIGEELNPFILPTLLGAFLGAAFLDYTINKN